ncbi:MAG TPA: glycosyltransferase family 39 protein [Gemmatimonadales bacterium]|nr:glycosyltransferase family 39 protein [Gemmatimonadales bacterium]
MKRPSWAVLVILVLILAAMGLRVAAALRPGLWADEIFSLAMATGHSLEHAAVEARPELGDFVEPPEAQPPAAFARYAQHEQPSAGLGQVIHAVLLSDTSPPLYYLLLHGWTRMFGTGDGALRLFSVSWAVLALPLFWLLARELGSRRVAWTACLLFAVSPVAIYYSTEGRMYSLLWWIVLGFVWLTLALARRWARPWIAGLWVLAGAAGLLTHYFFAFVWLACVAWLCRYAPQRRRVVALAGATWLAVLPWYVNVPSSLAHWRITGGWLNGDLTWPGALLQPLVLAGSLLDGRNYLGGWRGANALALGLLALGAAWILWHRSCHRIVSRRARLLWACVAAACIGPVVFDMLRHTSASNVPRYALAGLPAAILLAALAVGRMPRTLQAAMLGALVLAWLPAEKAMVAGSPRPWEPYADVGARLGSWARPGDLVVVHAIPSGLIGVARHVRPDIALASWVVQLGTRVVPDDLERLLAGRRRVAVVRIHDVGAEPVAATWLRTHAKLIAHDTFRSSSAEVLYFEPASGDTFFPATASVPSR